MTIGSFHRFPMLLLPGALALLTCRAPSSEALQGKAGDAIRTGIEKGRGSFDQGAWDEILSRHVRDGGRRFDYLGLNREHADVFDAYLDRLRKVDLASLSKPELKALLINAYNAFTVKTILETLTPDGQYGVRSIRDIARVFDRQSHRLGGFDLSLNQIEHNILRPLFRDPRVHFAVNCASVSCPPLRPRAFTGAHVEEELETAARDVLGSPDYVRAEADRLRVTKILDWYGGDFVDARNFGAEKSLAAYLRKYASPEMENWWAARTSDPAIDFMSYDWSLNRAP